jgi:hypothetical protein
MERRFDGVKFPLDRRGGHRWLGIMFVFLSFLVAMSISGCGDQDAGWRATRDAVGARDADEAIEQQRWRGYRQEVVVSLDEMRTVLEGSPGTETVIDKQEAESLLERIAVLRNRFVHEASLPPEQAEEKRPELVETFETTRRDVDAFLRRLGHDPADMAYWQDVERPG